MIETFLHHYAIALSVYHPPKSIELVIASAKRAIFGDNLAWICGGLCVKEAWRMCRFPGNPNLAYLQGLKNA